MTQIGPFPSSVEVGILAYPGAHEAAMLGMADLLAIANRFATEQGGSLKAKAQVHRWSLDTSGRITRDDNAENIAGPHVLIIPGRLSGPVSTEEAAPFVSWIRTLHDSGTTLASSCAGSFILAEAGLLDGRPASTHWADADEFRTRFRNVSLKIDEIIVEGETIVTAGGLMAWTDLGMRLCERIFGTSVMMQTSRFMLVDTAGREQRNYKSFKPRMDHGDDAILSVQHMLRDTEGQAIDVAHMSRHAKLEERTFLRRFKSATGLRPTEYVQTLRIEKAKEMLQLSRRPVEQIARIVGYRDMAAFRRLFRRETGMSPAEYRRRF
ncbi:helix-turn-helix domain-containing protein [Rhizobium sp. S152]|uniref:GlxA family transcriptional regulator n=1 Tax=Rhizobium sp. S152 TaxID=3055038 RepID=UPI0025A9C397|nr:helix-turn-helix domain-containing protein [Rhizobium sp. S152]MDM9625194.1 helix-turn-helix domain-containing protein [Rhizobium sp. S152]